MPEQVSVTLPIPPASLSKNGGHGHWSTHHSQFQEYALIGKNKIREAAGWDALRWAGPVTLTIRWYATKRQWPDDDNAIARCAAYRDAAQSAGLVLNDRQIQTLPVIFDVDKHNPRVELTFTREDGA